MSFSNNSINIPTTDLDVFLSSLNEKIPAVAAIIGSVIAQGNIFVFSDQLNEKLSAHTNLKIQKLDFRFPQLHSNSGANDIIFIETDSLEILADLAGKTCAQIIVISDLNLNSDGFFDYLIRFNELNKFFSEIDAGLKVIENNLFGLNLFSHEPQPAVFLDRDGVVVEHVDHLSKAEDVVLKNGVSDFIKKSRDLGYLIVIVTNQSGIGRQLFSRMDYERVNRQMLHLLASDHTYIDQILFSPFFENSKLAVGLISKSLRKPRSGMILRAARDLNINLNRSIIIGDRATDIIAGVMAKLDSAYLLDSKNVITEKDKFYNWLKIYPEKIKTSFVTIDKFSSINLQKY